MFKTTALSLVCLCAALPAFAQAYEPTEPLISVEVIDGWETADGTRMMGLRLSVAEEWKTYWRAPGDSGVPPLFDWSGSDNLRSAQILWPRPEVFDSFGMRALGYSGEVVLPVEIMPEDPDQPVTLSGQAELGMCREICVSVRTDFLNDGRLLPNEIEASLLQQPDQQISHAHCHITPIEDGLRLSAELTVPDLGGTEVAVVELMQDQSIWISEPVASRTGEVLTATADLVPPEAAPFALDRSQLRFTVLGRDGASETIGCLAG